MIIFLAIAVLLVVAYELETSVSDIAGYASKAGFSGADLAIAVAIAYAESSGNSQAIGDLDLGVSVGLWQINLRAHPEYTQEELLDPQTNANAAYVIYRRAGNKFTPWTTFKTGAYQQYSGQAQQETGTQIAEESEDMGDEFYG